MPKVGRSEEGRKNRQAILDYLNANPESSAKQMCTALGVEYHPLLTRLRDMRRMQEIKGRFVGAKADGYLVFSALVTTTAEKYPADKAKEERRAEREEKKLHGEDIYRSRTRARKQTPGITVHRINDRPPIPNQGGQGCAYATTRRTGTCLEVAG